MPSEIWYARPAESKLTHGSVARLNGGEYTVEGTSEQVLNSA